MGDISAKHRQPGSTNPPDTVANDVCFRQKHWWMKARGQDVDSWFDEGKERFNAGIINPKEVHLRVGQFYYRFASSRSSRDAQVGGAWWLDFENFNTINRYAIANDLNIRLAARLFLALPEEWTRIDRLVRAELCIPLKAYAGLGDVAFGPSSDATAIVDRNDMADPSEIGHVGGRWTPMQHIRTTQLYIPGLYIARDTAAKHQHREPQLYTRAFPNPEIEYISGTGRRYDLA